MFLSGHRSALHENCCFPEKYNDQRAKREQYNMWPARGQHGASNRLLVVCVFCFFVFFAESSQTMQRWQQAEMFWCLWNKKKKCFCFENGDHHKPLHLTQAWIEMNLLNIENKTQTTHTQTKLSLRSSNQIKILKHVLEPVISSLCHSGTVLQVIPLWSD